MTIGGMAKGSGMIHPNMATMLGVSLGFSLSLFAFKKLVVDKWCTSSRSSQPTPRSPVMFGEKWFRLRSAEASIRLAYVLFFRFLAVSLLSLCVEPVRVWVFSCAQVDGDTSTNDTVIALASGLSGAPRISSLDTHEAKELQSSLDAVTFSFLFFSIYCIGNRNGFIVRWLPNPSQDKEILSRGKTLSAINSHRAI